MNDNVMVLTIWELFEEDVPASKKYDRAYDFLRALEDTGVEVDLPLLKGENGYLDHAISKMHDEDETYEDEEYEEDEEY